MSLLLDTHVLLWAGRPAHLVPSRLAEMLEKPGVEPAFSAISIWEIAIKFALRRPDFPYDPEIVRSAALGAGYREIDFTGNHALAVATLPRLHGDPFDRALVAQAMSDGLILVTRDRRLGGYGDVVRTI